jgi:small subunit ribosomal protein S16
VAVKIRLKRMGKIRAPYYRIVVADSRTKRDGRVIEEIGKYHPKEHPSFIEVDSERAQYWLGVGAQASEPVAAILRVTGDWQRFKGEAAPAPMQVAEPRRDKTEIFNEALKDSVGEPKAEATTPRRSTAKKAASSPAAQTPRPAAATTAEVTPDEETPVAQESPVGDAAAADEAVVEDAPAADASAAGEEALAVADVAAGDLPTGAVPPGADAAPAGGDTAMAQGVSEVATDAPGTADEAEPTAPEA